MIRETRKIMNFNEKVSEILNKFEKTKKRVQSNANFKIKREDLVN